MGELEKLIEGNKKYIEGNLSQKDIKGMRDGVVNGQKPFVTIVTCSDSRVVPEYIFDAGIGELFIVRAAGNILDKAIIGSVEYGVGHLHTQLLVILGHSKCGAVTAACSNHQEGNCIDYIMKKIKPAVKEEDVEGSIEENIRCVMKEIKRKSKTVKTLVKEGKLKIVGMKYSLETGEVREVSKK